MKKTISAVLALVMLALCAVCVIPASAEDLTKVYYVTLPEDKYCVLTPCEGYSPYVVEGQDFKFEITPNEGYSLDMCMLSYYTADGKDRVYYDIDRNEENIYTIEAVAADTFVEIEYVIPTQDATFFRTLIEFFRQFLNWLQELFGIPVGDQTA